MHHKQNLGVLGPVGSGKGFAAKYISRKYGYRMITMGNIVRSLAKKEGIKPTRPNLEKVQRKYRDKYGSDFVIQQAIKKAQTSKRPVVLDGLRAEVDAVTAKKILGAKLILVDADPEVRFERMKRRRRADFSKTFEDFKKIEALEDKTFHLNKTFSHADYKADNTDGKKSLYDQLSKIMKKLNK